MQFLINRCFQTLVLMEFNKVFINQWTRENFVSNFWIDVHKNRMPRKHYQILLCILLLQSIHRISLENAVYKNLMECSVYNSTL